MDNKKPSNFAERFYSQIDNDYEGRACKDITDAQCREVPANFLAILLALLVSKLGDTFASPKIVLPWLIASTGAPQFFSSMLVPIRESGSMLPQLVFGAKIRQYPKRQSFLIVSAIIQSLSIIGLIFVALFLEGYTAGITIVLLLILFSLSRAISSIAVKDVIGKTIPKAKRGRQSGYAASLAGLVSIGFGVCLVLFFKSNDSVFWLLVLSGLCFFASGLLYLLLEEYKGATDGGVNGFKESFENLKLFKTDKDFQLFVIVRALMMSSSLVAPFLVIMVHQNSEGSLALGYFIIANGIADFISGSIWGKMADKNSKSLMQLTAALTCIICIATAALVILEPPYAMVISVALFFLLCVVHQGVRQGRKTYIVDIAGGTKRTDYVSVSNSLIGFLLLFTGLITGVLAEISFLAVFIFFAIASALAIVLSKKMKQVSDDS